MKTYKKAIRFAKNKKYIIIASLLALVLAGGIVKAQVSGGFWDKVAQYTAQIIGGKVDTPTLEDLTVGAMPGSELPGPCFSVSGLNECSYTSGMTNATNTICAFKSIATSTIIAASAYFNYGSTSDALYVDIGIGATAYATTTSLGTSIIPSTSGGYIIASTTSSVIEPNKWVVYKIAGGTGTSGASGFAGTSPVGSCQLKLRPLFTR